MQRRGAAAAVSAAALVQGALVWAGLPGWPCPLLHALGVPCPGCGLSRATVALAHGDWHTALGYHAFAPALLLALLLLTLATLLPAAPRRTLIAAVAAVERRTGLAVILSVGLVIYWLARLLLRPEQFIRLAQG